MQTPTKEWLTAELAGLFFFPRLHNMHEPVMVTAMNKGVQTPTKEWLKAGRWVFCPRRALGPLPAPAPRPPFFFLPHIYFFFLPQVHSSWLMPTEGV